MKKQTKLFAVSLAAVMVASVLSLASCVKNPSKEDEEESSSEKSYTVVDLRGREVEIPSSVDRIVCIGASALRLYSYVGDMNKLVGVEDFEKGDLMSVRPYSYAYKDLFTQLPSCGAGGPTGTADAEAIVSCLPDAVFSLYSDIESMDALQDRIGVPVVCFSYGGSDPFSDSVYTSLELMGKISGTEERAEAVIRYIKDIKEDLNARTADIAEEDKPTVYLGSNTYNGGNGSFGDTLVTYAPFRELNAKSVTSGLDAGTNNPTLDYETILSLNPDKVFIDVANISKLKAEYQSHREVFDELAAFQNNEIYVQMPFNQYYTNLEIAIADSYYIGSVLYPEAFADIDPEEKFDEICSFMLGKEVNYYERASSFYGRGFGRLDVSFLAE